MVPGPKAKPKVSDSSEYLLQNIKKKKGCVYLYFYFTAVL